MNSGGNQWFENIDHGHLGIFIYLTFGSDHEKLHAILAGWGWYERPLGAVQKGRAGSGSALWWHMYRMCCDLL